MQSGPEETLNTRKASALTLTVPFAQKVKAVIDTLPGETSVSDLRYRKNYEFKEFFKNLDRAEKTALGRALWAIPTWDRTLSLNTVRDVRKLSFADLRDHLTDVSAAFLTIAFGCKKIEFN